MKKLSNLSVECNENVPKQSPELWNYVECKTCNNFLSVGELCSLFDINICRKKHSRHRWQKSAGSLPSKPLPFQNLSIMPKKMIKATHCETKK